MAWYYHSGKVVRPVPVKKGLSVAVRPHSKVEILEVTPEVDALIRKGLLRITGKPKGAPSVKDAYVPSTNMANVKVSSIGNNVAEKGFSKSPSMKPVADGIQQMTVDEADLFEGSNADSGLNADGVVKEKVDHVEELPKNKKKKNKGKDRH